jgi:alpha-ribazole phosphatase
MILYLVRHPTPLDVLGVCYGRREVAIDAAGVPAVAKSVRARIGAAADRCRIFSSPSLRCMLLARAMSARREPVVAEELREMDFGSWEGRRWDELPREQLDAWARDVWRYRPGGAESAALVAERWFRWSAGLRERSGIAVVVTHAGLIRVALKCHGTLGTDEFAQHPIDYGSVHRIDLAVARATA